MAGSSTHSVLTQAVAACDPVAGESRFARIVRKYREGHRNPVNHFLHVAVGWPLVGASLLLLAFRPWWSLGLFLAGYAIMFAGHFIFERNIPTILRHPTTPFVMAGAVVANLWRGATGRASRVK